MKDRPRYRYRLDTPPDPRRKAPSGLVDRRIPGMPMPPDPFAELPFDAQDISDVRACCEGKANSEQAYRAMQALLAWSRAYESVSHPDPYVMNRWSGGRDIGLMIIKMVNYQTKAKRDGEHG